MSEQPISTRTFIIVLLVLLVSIISGLAVVYYILTLWLPSSLSVLVILFILKRIGLILCRFIVFPGSFSFFKQSTQNAFSKSLAKRALTQFTSLSQCLSQLPRQSRPPIDVELLTQFPNWFQHQVNVFTLMNENYSLTPDQEVNKLHNIQHYYYLLKHLNVLLDHLICSIDGQQINILQLLRQPALLQTWYTQDGSNQMINADDLSHAQGQVQDLIGTLTPYGGQPTSQLKQYMQNNILGTYDELRSYIEISYCIERFKLQTFDGYKLDCLLVKVDENPKSHPTMIMCNPNGAAYETLFHDTHWADFYLSQGFNIVFWNYRGYGLSEGTPDALLIQKDGEILVDFIRQKYQFTQIGVHGYSLGGQIACQLACIKKLNFLFADRTFSSLGNIGEHMFGSKVKTLFRLLTDWDRKVYRDYLDYKGERCIAVDPKDEIIPLEASLAYGVAVESFLQQKRVHSKSFKHYLKSFFFNDELENAFSDHIMPRKDFTQLFTSIQGLIHSLCHLQQEEGESFLRVPVEPFHEDETFLKNQMDITTQSFRELYHSNYKPFFMNLFNVICTLQNGFTSVYDLFQLGDVNEVQLMTFFIVGQVWSYGWISWKKFEQTSEKFISLYKDDSIVSKVSVVKEIRFIKSTVKQIMDVQRTENLIEETVDQVITIHDHQSMGELMLVQCGHNGSYSHAEFSQLERILRSSQLLSKNEL